MLLGENSILETHYDVLSVKEDASYEEIRTSYRSAILNSHPDKLQKTCETSKPDHESRERFLKVQRAWEVLSNFSSRAVYDSKLRALRQDAVTADDVSLDDMMVEDAGEALELFYQCRCGDYFSVDSLELENMGYVLLRDRNKISLQTPDASPASVVLPSLGGRGRIPVLRQVVDTYEKWCLRLSTASLTRWLRKVMSKHSWKHQVAQPKIKYFTGQVKARPPTFVAFVSGKRQLLDTDLRFLTKSLKEDFDLGGIPIRIMQRSASRKGAENTNKSSQSSGRLSDRLMSDKRGVST